MISFKRYLFFLIILILSIILSACSIKKQEPNISLPNYSEVAVLESRENSSSIYSIKDSDLIKIADINKKSEISYSNKKGIYAYLDNIGLGNSLIHNEINILSYAGMRKISNFFSASDIKLSPDATKLAFRRYKSDSLESAEGLKIYSITGGKYLNLKSKVLVSGSLYRWVNDNEIMYYGIDTGIKNGGEIYKYDFTKNSETQVLRNIEGYCTFFIPINGNVLYMAKDVNNSRLCFYDADLDKINVLSSDIGDVWDYAWDFKHNSIYLVANKVNEANCSIYKIELGSLLIQRITYDFPQMVEKGGGISLSSKGILYFCGISDNDKDSKDKLYSFNTNDESINIVNSRVHSGVYRVLSSESIKQP